MSIPTDGRVTDGRVQARRIILTQIFVTALVSAGFGIFSNLAAGGAALIGGLINVVANFYFARKLYPNKKAGQRVKSAVEQIILGLYVGEVVKLLITITLLALAISVFKLSFVPLFSAFVATLFVFWLALTPAFNRLLESRISGVHS